MLISAFTDTHGEFPPNLIKGDVILHGGDVYEDSRHWRGVEAWGALDKRVLAVRGNHDAFDPVNFFEGRELTVEELGNGLWAVGIGFATQDMSYGPYAIPTEHTMTEIVSERLKETTLKIPQGAQVVVLSHYAPASKFYPPKEGWYFVCLTALCEALRPVMMIHGHSHHMFGKEYYIGDVPALCPGHKGMTFEYKDGQLGRVK